MAIRACVSAFFLGRNQNTPTNTKLLNLFCKCDNISQLITRPLAPRFSLLEGGSSLPCSPRRWCFHLFWLQPCGFPSQAEGDKSNLKRRAEQAYKKPHNFDRIFEPRCFSSASAAGANLVGEGAREKEENKDNWARSGENEDSTSIEYRAVLHRNS